MAVVAVEKNTYKVEPLHQWDLNQSLVIEGLSLPSVPEIHFSTPSMSRAIVRPASMDVAGVVTVDIPNSLLQKSGKLFVFVCVYGGGTFETLYKLEVQVIARPQPEGYRLEGNDQEVYSFEALENAVQNVLHEHDVLKADLAKDLDAIRNVGKQYSVVTSDANGKLSNAGTPSADLSVLFGSPSKAPRWGTLSEIFGALGGVMVETGSYTGTGTGGADNPNRLTFKHKPVLVFVLSEQQTGSSAHLLVLARGTSATFTSMSGKQVVSDWTETNSLSWHSTETNDPENYQFNTSGWVYNYVALTTI